MIQFIAEIVEVKVKKAPSLDKVYRIVMETDQSQVEKLSKYVATEAAKVIVLDEGELMPSEGSTEVKK